MVNLPLKIGNLIYLRLNSSIQKDPLTDLVRNDFAANISPLYGDQTSALIKINLGSDRETELLFDIGKTNDFSQENLLAIIVYKKCLVNGYGEPTIDQKIQCLANSLEVKTLYVTSVARGRGIGDLILNRIIEVAMNLTAENIILTVGEHVTSFSFFQARGFKDLGRIKDKYVQGKYEHYLLFNIKEQSYIIDLHYSFVSKYILDIFEAEEKDNIIIIPQSEKLSKGKILRFGCLHEESVYIGFSASISEIKEYESIEQYLLETNKAFGKLVNSLTNPMINALKKHLIEEEMSIIKKRISFTNPDNIDLRETMIFAVSFTKIMDFFTEDSSELGQYYYQQLANKYGLT
jgi:GNAT superfamily N-acetyltransferase